MKENEFYDEMIKIENERNRFERRKSRDRSEFCVSIR